VGASELAFRLISLTFAARIAARVLQLFINALGPVDGPGVTALARLDFCHRRSVSRAASSSFIAAPKDEKFLSGLYIKPDGCFPFSSAIPTGGRELVGMAGGREVRLPFCILNVLGDVLDDGELNFVEAASSLDAAKARVQSLAESSPGDYVIYDEATGERVLIPAASASSAELREY